MTQLSGRVSMKLNNKGLGSIAVIAVIAVALIVPFLSLIGQYQATLNLQKNDDLRAEVAKTASLVGRLLVSRNVCTENFRANQLIGKTPEQIKQQLVELNYGNGTGGLGESIFTSASKLWRGHNNRIWGAVAVTQKRDSTSALIDITIIGESGDDRSRAKASTIFLAELNATGTIVGCQSTYKNREGYIIEDVVCRTRMGTDYYYSAKDKSCVIGMAMQASNFGDYR